MRAPGLALLAVALITGCGGPPPAQGVDDANVTTFLGSADDGLRFARAVAPREFDFPADHGGHPDFRSEWWYLTGNLETADGDHIGVQVTFFRFALASKPVVRASSFGASQLWMAHVAVTDTQAQRFHVAQKFERGALGLAGVRTAPFRVWLADWGLQSTGAAFFPLALNVDAGEFALELTVGEGKPLVLQGDDGLDAKGPEKGNASYYYSFTRLPTAGRVRLEDGVHEVRGSVWMDREWSTSVLGPQLEGWNWFALQLDDGSDLMVYRLRRKDGGTGAFSGGLLVDGDGRVTARFGADDFDLTPTEAWTSPLSGVRYDVGWRLAIPGLDIELALEPRLKDQELNLAVRYWEGAMTVSGTRGDRPVRGVGYAEHAGVSRRPSPPAVQ